MADLSPLQERRAVGSTAKRFRFSLKTMLLVYLPLTALLGLWVNYGSYYWEQRAIANQFLPYCLMTGMEDGSVTKLDLNKPAPKELYKKLPRLKRLRYLSVTSNDDSFGDREAAYLKGLDDLDFLTISSHDLTDEGMKYAEAWKALLRLMYVLVGELLQQGGPNFTGFHTWSP